MTLMDLFSDLISTLAISDVHAESPPSEDSEDTGSEDGAEDGAEGGDGDDDEGKDEPAAEEEAEEEEEEEEEPEDIKPRIEEECANSPQCLPSKHHYDECVERVTKQQEENENGKADEDCVEEFFHLTHCATQCAAPKLFRQLR